MHSTTPRSERILIPILFRTGLQYAARRVNRHKAVIVMYHGFTAEHVHPGIQNHEQKHVQREAFERDLRFLATHYRVVPLEDVVRALATGAPLPERAAVITIDDGYRSTYTVAYPLLVKFQLPAALFVATEFVDSRRFLWTDRVEYAIDQARTDTLEVTFGGETRRFDLGTRDARTAADRRLRSLIKALPQEARDAAVDAIEHAAGRGLCDAREDGRIYEPCGWDEVAEMARSGLVSIGSHTHSHVILSRCTPEHAARELSGSKQIIESRLGAPCRLFCYPNGRRGDFNATTKRLIKEQGFTGALTTVYGNNGRSADVYELRRYNLGKPLMAGELDVRLSGLMEVRAGVRRLVGGR